MDDEVEFKRDSLKRGTDEMPDTSPGKAASAPREASTTLATGERLSRRARLRRTVVTTGAVALAVAILAATLPNAGATLRAALGIPTPVPTAPLPIGAGTFLIEDTVPWGTLLVDGHPARFVPPEPVALAGSGPTAPTFVLGRGRHAVEYRAAPFPTLRCVISVPATGDDTCPLVQPSPGDPVHAFGAVRVLDLQARPERLPPEQEAALASAVATQLNADSGSVMVSVGERYLATDGSVRTASEPLRAQLVFAVNQDPGQLLPGDTGPCVALCRAYPLGYPIPEGSWRVAAHIEAMWRYTRLDGSVALANAPAASPERDAHMLVLVDARWTGSWVVTDRPSPPGCAVANNMLGDLLITMPPDSRPSGYAWSQFAAAPDSAGCLLTAAQTVDAFNNPVGPTAFVLYRFGALLAANDLAHQLFPTLPLADAQERALARSLAPPGAQG
jgi:hypothetical protein